VGGDAEDWIDRTVRVPTIVSLTLEEWLDEYKRLKTVNTEMMKAPGKAFPRAAKPQKRHHEATPRPGPTPKPRSDARPTREAPAHAAPPHTPAPRAARSDDSTRKEPCTVKARLLAELDQAHRSLVAIEEEELRAAREGRVDLLTLSTPASRERSKFDRALLAVRDHT